MNDLLASFAENKNWVLKYDPVMEYWIVCVALSDRNGWRVLAHDADPAEAIKRALDPRGSDGPAA